MKIALVGSRSIKIDNFNDFVSLNDEIVSGGANGVDKSAEDYAKRHNMKLTVFLPEYHLYGRAATIVRNKQIVDYSDKIIVFWDGKSKGSMSVIKYANKVGKECHTVIYDGNNDYLQK